MLGFFQLLESLGVCPLQNLEVFSHYFFNYFFSPTFSSLVGFQWHNSLVIVPSVANAQSWICLGIFSLCFSDQVISVVLSSNILILSYSPFSFWANPLLFFISRITYFSSNFFHLVFISLCCFAEIFYFALFRMSFFFSFVLSIFAIIHRSIFMMAALSF